MRTTLWVVCAVAWGLAAVGGLPAVAAGQVPRPSVYASSGSFQASAGGGLIAQFAATTAGPHTIAVIDPARQALAVYHVDAASGAITLKSVRNLSWDLQMIQFNSDGPSPQDVRCGLRSAMNPGTSINPTPNRAVDRNGGQSTPSNTRPPGG